MKHTESIPSCSLELDGRTLCIEEVISVARADSPISCSISCEARQRMGASNTLKRDLLATRQPIYGVTTGFGDSAKRQIAPEKAAALQENLVHYHLNGIGPLASPDVTRATLLIRANCLARGHSGVRVEVAERLLSYLQWDLLPLIPERGSVGASGDLVPLSYVASALMGQGEIGYQGEIREARGVLETLEIDPLTLEAKEGLALINGTSFMSAFATLATEDAHTLALLADACTAMALEALCGNCGPFHAFLHQQKPHPGQQASAQRICALLEDSALARTHQQILAANEALADRSYLELDRSIQDKYSLRCAPHIIGVLYDTLVWVRQWVEIEINSSNDNPLFDVHTQQAHSGGNFYGGHIAQAMDSLKIAVANLADLLDHQVELLVDEKFNQGLPANLIATREKDDGEAGLHHGFKGMQIACSALTAEILKGTNPASVFSRPTEAYNQDKVSLGTIAARDARTIVELTQQVMAIHLLTLCQALDLRGVEGMSPRTRAIYQVIRTTSPFVTQDRRMDADIAHVVELIRSKSLSQLLLQGSVS